MYNNKIRKYRKMQGITLTKLAKEAGITAGYLCHLEKGSKKNPSMQIMENISKALRKKYNRSIFF